MNQNKRIDLIVFFAVLLGAILFVTACRADDDLSTASLSATTIPVPGTSEERSLQDRVGTIESSMVQTFERFFRIEARLRRIETTLAIPGPDHQHDWQITNPPIQKKETVSAICRCGAFSYVPFKIQKEESK
jgi:hypothetical protein